jgi:hypothetical protein
MVDCVDQKIFVCQKWVIIKALQHNSSSSLSFSPLHHEVSASLSEDRAQDPGAPLSCLRVTRLNAKLPSGEDIVHFQPSLTGSIYCLSAKLPSDVDIPHYHPAPSTRQSSHKVSESEADTVPAPAGNDSPRM